MHGCLRDLLHTPIFGNVLHDNPSENTSYNWKRKYAGMGTTEIRRLRQLEEENSRLKKLVAELSLDKVMLQDILSKKD